MLDADEGIRFRGYSIPELQNELPAAIEGGEPLPEGLLWLLFTGEVPNKAQVESVTEMLRERSQLPPSVSAVLEAMPQDTHPMTKFAASVLALQPGSKFAAAYEKGVHKTKLWEYCFEDSLDLIAKLPGIAAHIYRTTYKGGDLIAADPKLDWAGNLSHMMGYDSEGAL